MKKFLMFMTAIVLAVTANAQMALETSRMFDNVGIGLHIGGTMPLDMNNWLPINTTAGIRLQKEVTPVLGFQVDGDVFFQDNHFANLPTFVKATNLGLNGMLNLNNWFCGYNGNRRLFEIKTVGGLGWLHLWNTSANALTAKTGLSFAFNVGKQRQHTLSLDPMVWWNLNATPNIQFNKNHAQLGIGVSYIYHFKNSNGTHSFKMYDIEAMQYEIARLHDQVRNQKKDTIVKVISNTINKIVEKKVPVANQTCITFEKSSAELTKEAKAELDKIPQGTKVTVEATASPEGTPKFNQELSQQRAEAVAQYLRNRNVQVVKAEGLGVVNNSSQRMAKVTYNVD